MTPETPTSLSTESDTIEPVIPREGWHVLHLFYKIEHSQWELYSDEEKLEAKTHLTQLVQDIRSSDSQLMTFSMVTPKADLGFMLLTADLHEANEFEKKLTLSLGADVLTPTYSYLSMTELSEYTTTREQYGQSLVEEDGIEEGSTEFNEKVEEFDRRMKKYNSDRLYPNMPDWQVFCFYPMGKRRGEQDNWYDMDYEERRKLMMGHAKVGRTYAGRVRQLITGSTGLDEMEWGVTLFAHDTQEIKNIVYEMRFDKVSSRYADFGDFFIGLQLPLNHLFQRLGI